MILTLNRLMRTRSINLKYFLLFNFQVTCKKTAQPTINALKPHNIFTIEQTFGMKTILSLRDQICGIKQLDVSNKMCANGSFTDKSSITKKKFGSLLFSFRKAYNNNKESIDIYGFEKSNELLVINSSNKNNEKKEERYKTNNIYYLLPEILKFDITMGSAPDYMRKENEIILKHGHKTAKIYQLYYASMGKYRVYNSLTYLNEQVNIRMGHLLNLLDNPAFIIHSGDGKEIFVYLGVHFCPKDKKIYYGLLLLSFDILSICRDLFYYVETCPHCHSNIPGNLNNGKALLKIQKNYKN